ncbi:polysaccharide deacetylase family protein [Bradyrhizobium sp.]|uniref:polysaccharide deacetylase family protein n=1 Tax=Bradyrhizobium sp. TaxID=376 RepID=UPI004037E669
MRIMDSRRSHLCFAAALGLSGALALPAFASDCPHRDALGTSRTIAVEAATTPRVGLRSFPNTLDLRDREIVLTFDDGPSPAVDEKILAALAEQCVRATFFLIGKRASEYPEMVRKMAAAGHTVAHHSWSHQNLKKITPDEAQREIDLGIAAVEAALGITTAASPSTPFFRYPYFEMSEPSLDHLARRGIVVFGADLWADDWIRMTPEAQLARMIDSVKSAGKGILLLHDSSPQTAAALPDFLRYLRDNGYSIVHVVPAASATPLASVGQNEKRE